MTEATSHRLSALLKDSLNIRMFLKKNLEDEVIFLGIFSLHYTLGMLEVIPFGD